MVHKCFICGRYAHTDTHHLLPGAKRQKADKYGLVAEMCRECHRKVHDHPKDFMWLREVAQQTVMQEQGWDTERFIKEFGRNYL